jgi:small subunit ribosomal protein S19e
LIGLVSGKLKDFPEIKPPDWAWYVKTGVHKERMPDDRDWWYVRSAAILRAIHNGGPVGVERLRTKYGGKKAKGNRPPVFAKGSGSIQRRVCQQLEAAGLVEKTEKHGRVLSAKGKSFLDKCAEEAAGG